MPISKLQQTMNRVLTDQVVTRNEVVDLINSTTPATEIRHNPLTADEFEPVTRLYRDFVAGTPDAPRFTPLAQQGMDELLGKLEVNDVARTRVQNIAAFGRKTASGLEPFDALHRGLSGSNPALVEEGLACLEAAVRDGIELGPDWSRLYFSAVKSMVGAEAIARLARLGVDPNLADSDLGEPLQLAVTDRIGGGYRATPLHRLLMDNFTYSGTESEHFSEALPVPGAPDSDTLHKNLKALLDAGADPNAQPVSSYSSSGGPTPLMLAALWRTPFSVEATRTLIAAGADVNVRALGHQGALAGGLYGSMPTGMTALGIAQEFKTPLVAEVLVEAGARFPFFEEIAAARAENVEAVQAALTRGADPEFIWMHADLKDERVVRTLLAAGLDPNGTMLNDAGQHLPVIHQVQVGSPALKALVEAGAKVDGRDENGDTRLLSVLTPPGYVSRVRLEPFPQSSMDPLSTGLFTSTSERYSEDYLALLELGADVNARGLNGDTPLIRELYAPHDWRNVQVIDVLLSRGADPNATNDHGVGAMALALRYPRPRSLARLLEAGVDVNAPVSPFGIPPWAVALDALQRARHIPKEGLDTLEVLLQNDQLRVDPSAPGVDGIVQAALQHEVLKPWVEKFLARAG